MVDRHQLFPVLYTGAREEIAEYKHWYRLHTFQVSGRQSDVNMWLLIPTSLCNLGLLFFKKKTQIQI